MSGAKYIWLVWMLLFCGIKDLAAQNRNSLQIASDRLVLTIDIKSPSGVLDSILKVAGIGNAHSATIMKGDFAAINNDGWQLTSRRGDVIQFERLLINVDYDPQDRPFWVTTMIPSVDGKPGYPADVKYGVNKYAKITVYELSSGLTRFILPGFERAKRAFLSGNFNDWSTLKGLMKRTDGGWILDLKLDPGAYEYKFIVDGRWMTDPNNLQRVDDGAGNVNSVYFKYNFTFRLAGYRSTKRVMVAGDFNNWDANELVMEKTGKGWDRQIYLAEGKYYYRFMVDGEWITDPANRVKVKNKDINKSEDKYGYLNSVLHVGEPAVFRLAGYPDANSVKLSGDFDGFDADDLQLQKKGSNWILSLILPAGNYDYRFMVDNKQIRDPANPHYSVKDGEEWSFLAVKPNYTFKLKGHGDAKKVTLCGTFNNWQPDGYSMGLKGGEWTISFHLKPEKYLYKFRVDGDWILDPGNKLWEKNEPHTGNSVLWIE